LIEIGVVHILITAGVNFTNILCTAFRSQKLKKIDNLTVFFTLLGAAHVKAVQRTLMKLSPGHLQEQETGLLHLTCFHNLHFIFRADFTITTFCTNLIFTEQTQIAVTWIRSWTDLVLFIFSFLFSTQNLILQNYWVHMIELLSNYTSHQLMFTFWLPEREIFFEPRN